MCRWDLLWSKVLQLPLWAHDSPNDTTEIPQKTVAISELASAGMWRPPLSSISEQIRLDASAELGRAGGRSYSFRRDLSPLR